MSPEAKAPALQQSPVLVAQNTVPLPPDNHPDNGILSKWSPVLTIPGSTDLYLVKITGKISFDWNELCPVSQCPNTLDGTSQGPLEQGGRVDLGHAAPGTDVAGGALPTRWYPKQHPDGDGTAFVLSRSGTTRTLWARRSGVGTGCLKSGSVCDPNNRQPQYFLSGSQTITLHSVPEPVSVTGPTSVAPGQPGTFTATIVENLPADLDGNGNKRIFWTYLEGDTLATPGGGTSRNVFSCNTHSTCSYIPAKNGRVKVTAYVQGIALTGYSPIVRIGAADPCAGTASASGASFTCAEAPPQLTVTCLPATVERGAAVRCTAIPTPAAQMTVTRLIARGPGFSNAENHNAVIAAGDSAVWAGTAVATTQVRFVAQVQMPGGTATTVRGDGGFAVSPRTWAPYQLTTVPVWDKQLRGTMTAFPSNGVMGNFSLNGLNPFSTPIDSVASGPNAGLMYYTERPPYIGNGATVAMHPGLYPPASPPDAQRWYDDQNGTPSGTCTQADITLLRAEAERHEGLTQAPNSHYGIANQAFLTHRPDRTLEELYRFRVPKARMHDHAYRVYRSFVVGPQHNMQNPFDNSDYPLILAKFTCQFDNNKANS
jgi:hypothetical protein